MADHGFTEVSKQLLNKQWLVKIDNNTSCSYLFKFHRSSENQCCILVTDFINVWCEVLDPRYLTRRWRPLNNNNPPRLLERDEESTWRAKIAHNLSNIHTPLAIQETTFSTEESYEADLAIELRNMDLGSWRWECYKLGLKTTSQLLSIHLLLPLLSVVNLAFTSADPVSELSTSDLEEAVDNIAKAGRRTQAIFIRQTLSRPRVATTIARLSAMLNITDCPPPIQDDYESPVDVDTVADGGVINVSTTATGKSPSYSGAGATQSTAELPNAPSTSKRKLSLSPQRKEEEKGNSDGSTTEPDTDNDDKRQPSPKALDVTESQLSDIDQNEYQPSIVPAAKKIKPSSSDKASMAENESSVNTQSTSTSGHPVRKAGIRQPMKRGGKRF